MGAKNVGSNGVLERVIFFILGCIMGLIGLLLAYIAYRLALRNYGIDYQELYMGGCIGLSFFLLRGAWFTVIPEKHKTEIRLSHDR